MHDHACMYYNSEAVMNQKDPNNISGLLKMHLRERNLLTEESIHIIKQCITQDMVSSCMVEPVNNYIAIGL